jgi:integral membrane protein
LKNLFAWFRKSGLAEGISFLLLLFIAMPLKYFAGLPLAVTVVGAVHGALFILFCILAYLVWSQNKKTWKWLGIALAASIVPFGTFIADKKWRTDPLNLTK